MMADLATSNILTLVRLNTLNHIFEHFFSEHYQCFQSYFRFSPDHLQPPCKCYIHSATGLGDLHREFPGAFRVFNSPSGSGLQDPITPTSDSPIPVPPRFVEGPETRYFSLSDSS